MCPEFYSEEIPCGLILVSERLPSSTTNRRSSDLEWSLTIYILWFRSTRSCTHKSVKGAKCKSRFFKNITIQGVTENSFVLFLVGTFDKCHCMEASFEREGCYGDQENHRLLRYHILNEAQKRMTNFWLPFLPDSESNPLPDFICRCAAEAKKRGFDVFGIKNYGTCSGASRREVRGIRRPPLIFRPNWGHRCVI